MPDIKNSASNKLELMELLVTGATGTSGEDFSTKLQALLQKTPRIGTTANPEFLAYSIIGAFTALPYTGLMDKLAIERVFIKILSSHQTIKIALQLKTPDNKKSLKFYTFAVTKTAGRTQEFSASEIQELLAKLVNTRADLSRYQDNDKNFLVTAESYQINQRHEFQKKTMASAELKSYLEQTIEKKRVSDDFKEIRARSTEKLEAYIQQLSGTEIEVNRAARALFSKLASLYRDLQDGTQLDLHEREVNYHGFCSGIVEFLLKQQGRFDIAVERNLGLGRADLMLLSRKGNENSNNWLAIPVAVEFKAGLANTETAAAAVAQIKERGYLRYLPRMRTIASKGVAVGVNFDRVLPPVESEITNIVIKPTNFFKRLRDLGDELLQSKKPIAEFENEIKASLDDITYSMLKGNGAKDNSRYLEFLLLGQAMGSALGEQTKLYLFVAENTANCPECSVFLVKHAEKLMVLKLFSQTKEGPFSFEEVSRSQIPTIRNFASMRYLKSNVESVAIFNGVSQYVEVTVAVQGNDLMELEVLSYNAEQLNKIKLSTRPDARDTLGVLAEIKTVNFMEALNGLVDDNPTREASSLVDSLYQLKAWDKAIVAENCLQAVMQGGILATGKHHVFIESNHSKERRTDLVILPVVGQQRGKPMIVELKFTSNPLAAEGLQRQAIEQLKGNFVNLKSFSDAKQAEAIALTYVERNGELHYHKLVRDIAHSSASGSIASSLQGLHLGSGDEPKGVLRALSQGEKRPSSLASSSAKKSCVGYSRQRRALCESADTSLAAAEKKRIMDGLDELYTFTESDVQRLHTDVQHEIFAELRKAGVADSTLAAFQLEKEKLASLVTDSFADTLDQPLSRLSKTKLRHWFSASLLYNTFDNAHAIRGGGSLASLFAGNDLFESMGQFLGSRLAGYQRSKAMGHLLQQLANNPLTKGIAVFANIFQLGSGTLKIATGSATGEDMYWTARAAMWTLAFAKVVQSANMVFLPLDIAQSLGSHLHEGEKRVDEYAGHIPLTTQQQWYIRYQHFVPWGDFSRLDFQVTAKEQVFDKAYQTFKEMLREYPFKAVVWYFGGISQKFAYTMQAQMHPDIPNCIVDCTHIKQSTGYEPLLSNTRSDIAADLTNKSLSDTLALREDFLGLPEVKQRCLQHWSKECERPTSALDKAIHVKAMGSSGTPTETECQLKNGELQGSACEKKAQIEQDIQDRQILALADDKIKEAALFAIPKSDAAYVAWASLPEGSLTSQHETCSVRKKLHYDSHCDFTYQAPCRDGQSYQCEVNTVFSDEQGFSKPFILVATQQEKGNPIFYANAPSKDGVSHLKAIDENPAVINIAHGEVAITGSESHANLFKLQQGSYGLIRGGREQDIVVNEKTTAAQISVDFPAQQLSEAGSPRALRMQSVEGYIGHFNATEKMIPHCTTTFIDGRGSAQGDSISFNATPICDARQLVWINVYSGDVAEIPAGKQSVIYNIIDIGNAPIYLLNKNSDKILEYQGAHAQRVLLNQPLQALQIVKIAELNSRLPAAAQLAQNQSVYEISVAGKPYILTNDVANLRYQTNEGYLFSLHETTLSDLAASAENQRHYHSLGLDNPQLLRAIKIADSPLDAVQLTIFYRFNGNTTSADTLRTIFRNTPLPINRLMLRDDAHYEITEIGTNARDVFRLDQAGYSYFVRGGEAEDSIEFFPAKTVAQVTDTVVVDNAAALLGQDTLDLRQIPIQDITIESPTTAEMIHYQLTADSLVISMTYANDPDTHHNELRIILKNYLANEQYRHLQFRLDDSAALYQLNWLKQQLVCINGIENAQPISFLSSSNLSETWINKEQVRFAIDQHRHLEVFNCTAVTFAKFAADKTIASSNQHCLIDPLRSGLRHIRIHATTNTSAIPVNFALWHLLDQQLHYVNNTLTISLGHENTETAFCVELPNYVDVSAQQARYLLSDESFSAIQLFSANDIAALNVNAARSISSFSAAYTVVPKALVDKLSSQRLMQWHQQVTRSAVDRVYARVEIENYREAIFGSDATDHIELTGTTLFAYGGNASDTYVIPQLGTTDAQADPLYINNEANDGVVDTLQLPTDLIGQQLWQDKKSLFIRPALPDIKFPPVIVINFCESFRYQHLKIQFPGGKLIDPRNCDSLRLQQKYSLHENQASAIFSNGVRSSVRHSPRDSKSQHAPQQPVAKTLPQANSGHGLETYFWWIVGAGVSAMLATTTVLMNRVMRPLRRGREHVAENAVPLIVHVAATTSFLSNARAQEKPVQSKRVKWDTPSLNRNGFFANAKKSRLAESKTALVNHQQMTHHESAASDYLASVTDCGATLSENVSLLKLAFHLLGKKAVVKRMNQVEQMSSIYQPRNKREEMVAARADLDKRLDVYEQQANKGIRSYRACGR